MAERIEILLSEEEVDKRISEIGEQITKDYAGKDVHLICVLKGGSFFMCELAKRINLEVSIDFMSVSSYGDDTKSSGVVKIVKDLDEAILRVKRDAAPPNCQRLGNATYCFNTGECVSIKDKAASEMCDGCSSDDRICCNYLVSAFQRHKGRIKVIIVGDTLGY